MTPTGGWRVSPQAAALHADALVWDMVFVYEPEMDNDYRHLPALEKRRSRLRLRSPGRRPTQHR